MFLMLSDKYDVLIIIVPFAGCQNDPGSLSIRCISRFSFPHFLGNRLSLVSGEGQRICDRFLVPLAMLFYFGLRKNNRLIRRACGHGSNISYNVLLNKY